MYRGFELRDSDLRSLNPHDAVYFFRELLWAEASHTGVIQSSAHVPQRITVPDGGLDAKVEDADPSREDLIPKGVSGFQIKASDMEPAECKEEIRDDSGNLAPRIKQLVEDDGTYVLVVFEELVGVSKIKYKDKLERRQDAIEEEFDDQGYPDTKVRVCDSTKLVGLVNRFPSLVAKRKGLQHVRDYETWRKIATNGVGIFVSDKNREQAIEQIQEEIRTPSKSCSVVRITGLPDVGKTRLVFEALSPDDLHNRVIYTTSREFDCSGVASKLQMDSEWSAIVVVDDCGPDDHEHFHRQFSPLEDRLTLITISSNNIDTDCDLHIEVEQLSDDKIVEMLKQRDKND